jgi:hypothetical protein
MTPWAPHLFHLMLLHHQPHLWQVMDLSAFLDLPCDPFQRLLAMVTDHGPMTHHLIGGGYLQQTVPSMSWLPSRLLPACVALAPTLSSGAVTRRRLAAVLAIFRQPPFEFVDPPKCLASLLQRSC